jgi:hypothetical protein
MFTIDQFNMKCMSQGGKEEEEEEVFFGSITIRELERAINLHDNSTFLVEDMSMTRHPSCMAVSEHEIACTSVRLRMHSNMFVSLIFMILHLRRGLRRRRLKKQKIIEESACRIIQSYRSYRFRKIWYSCMMQVHEASMMLTRFQACARGFLTRHSMIRLSNLSLNSIERKDYNDIKDFFPGPPLIGRNPSKIPRLQSMVMPIVHEPCFSVAFSGPASNETHKRIITQTLQSSEGHLENPSDESSLEIIPDPHTRTRLRSIGEDMRKLRRKGEHRHPEKECLRLTEINTLLNRGSKRNSGTRIVKTSYISRPQPEMKYRGYNGDDSIYDRHEPGSGHVYWKELLIETSDVKHSPHHKTVVPRRSCIKVNHSLIHEYLLNLLFIRLYPSFTDKIHDRFPNFSEKVSYPHSESRTSMPNRSILFKRNLRKNRSKTCKT